jgi:polysaccharide biosynthesis PFTS motif protein
MGSGHIPADAEIYAGHFRDADRLADAYFFLPQALGTRPWWSYIAERLGSRIVMTFYSHNFQAQFHPPAYPPIYKKAVWPEAIVMTDQCEAVLRDAGAKIGKCVVDPSVSVLDSGARIEMPRKLLVAVCDIDPRPDRPLHYHSEEVVLAFLDQVSRAIVSVGAVPVWKPKGALKQEHSLVAGDVRPNAERYLAIAERYGAIICPSGMPIGWLADQIDCAVCLPFTSAATTFSQTGRDVAYFDPTGMIADQTVPARGHTIITEYAELQAWLHTSLGEDLHQLDAEGVRRRGEVGIT